MRGEREGEKVNTIKEITRNSIPKRTREENNERGPASMTWERAKEHASCGDFGYPPAESGAA